MNESNSPFEFRCSQSQKNAFADATTVDDAVSRLTNDRDDVKKLSTMYQELANRDASTAGRFSTATEVVAALALRAKVAGKILCSARPLLVRETKNEVAESEAEHAPQKELFPQTKYYGLRQ